MSKKFLKLPFSIFHELIIVVLLIKLAEEFSCRHCFEVPSCGQINVKQNQKKFMPYFSCTIFPIVHLQFSNRSTGCKAKQKKKIIFNTVETEFYTTHIRHRNLRISFNISVSTIISNRNNLITGKTCINYTNQDLLKIFHTLCASVCFCC